MEFFINFVLISMGVCFLISAVRTCEIKWQYLFWIVATGAMYGCALAYAVKGVLFESIGAFMISILFWIAAKLCDDERFKCQVVVDIMAMVNAGLLEMLSEDEEE